MTALILVWRFAQSSEEPDLLEQLRPASQTRAAAGIPSLEAAGNQDETAAHEAVVRQGAIGF